MPLHFRVLRKLLLISSLVLFLFALAYGPGRGAQLIPSNFDHAGALYTVKIFVYALFVLGAYISLKQPKVAAILLGIGMLGRCVMEWVIPVAQETLMSDHWQHPIWLATVIMFYVVSFVLPALHMIDCFRIGRRRALRGSALPD